MNLLSRLEAVFTALELVEFDDPLNRIVIDRFVDKFSDSTAYAKKFALECDIFSVDHKSNQNSSELPYQIVDKNLDTQEIIHILLDLGKYISQSDRDTVSHFLEDLGDEKINPESASKYSRHRNYHLKKQDNIELILNERKEILLGNQANGLKLVPVRTTNWEVRYDKNLILNNLGKENAAKILVDINVIAMIYTARQRKGLK